MIWCDACLVLSLVRNPASQEGAALIMGISWTFKSIYWFMLFITYMCHCPYEIGTSMREGDCVTGDFIKGTLEFLGYFI